MFKKTVNIAFLLFASLFIVLLSCDGRKHKTDLLKAAITNFNKTSDPIEIVNFVPKNYNQVVQDSILSNGYNVSIKTYTNMKKTITNVITNNAVSNKTHFRCIETDVLVTKNNSIIFNEKIDANFIATNLPNLINANNFVGNAIAINYEATLKHNKLVLTASLYKPKSTNCISFHIIIDENGHFTTENINTYART